MSKRDVQPITDTELCADASPPANGDPYVAVLMETNENGVAINTEPITLGTGFDSLDAIGTELQRRLNTTAPDSLPLDFTPDQAHIFGLTGTVTFATTPEYTVEIDDNTYVVDATTPADARHHAASKHKAANGGPYVGLSVSDIAQTATIIDHPDE